MTEPQADERSIFLRAIELDPGPERAAFLDAACGADPAVRADVEGLLAAHYRPAPLLDAPVVPGATTDGPAPERPGTVLGGRYKLLEEIGEGGMGTVWMAQQTEPVRRTVAVKLIRPGMDSKQVLARFEAERQALALMDHPNIAKVHDAGAAPDGRPFFAMELVKGVPITRYCDEHYLTPWERLELFVPVCQAVQHAHQKGVIHRDLKPSNVLVALYDDKPIPKVIDFGVAKATGEQLTEQTLHTGFGAVVGTVEYMSPEQATFNQLDVDTRSDVYSLGVLLYELLTGTTPLDRKRVKETPLLELLRIVREDDTVRLSARLSTVEELPAIAARRGVEPRRLRGLVRGELDWIVMRALEKERGRRYETASAFAADVRRYLRDEPVEACPPSAAYRFRRFAHRNKRGLIAVSLVGIALLLGLLGTAWQAIRATTAERVAKTERDRAMEAEKLAKAESERASQEAAKAKTEAAIAKAVNDFINEDLLAQADPYQQPDRHIKLRSVLDRAADRIEARFADQPLVEAAIRATLGKTYLTMGEHIESERHLKRARDLYRQELGEEDPLTLKSATRLGQAYAQRGFEDDSSQALEEARQLLEQTAELQRRILGEEDIDTVWTRMSLASVLNYQGRPEEGLVLVDQLLPWARRNWGDEHRGTLRLMNSQGCMLKKLRRFSEALPVFEHALGISRRVRGEADPYTFVLEDNLAQTLTWMKGRTDDALRHRLRVVDGRRQVLGEEHPSTNWSVLNLRLDVRHCGAAPAGGPGRAVELVQGIVQATPQSGAAWTALGMARYEAGEWRSAIEAFEKSLEVRKSGSSADWFLLSMACSRLGNYEAARKWFDQAVQWMDRNQPDNRSLRQFRAGAAKIVENR